MRTDPRREVERLREEIRRHDHLYYVLARPEVTDAEYDGLFRRLQELEKAHPALVTPDSPTQRVGGATDSLFAPVRHALPMLSLDNVFDEEEIGEWHQRVLKGLKGEPQAFVVEPKIDGVSCALTYEKGRLSVAATRGDGERGEDVTANVRTIRPVPLALLTGEPPDLLDVRGEVYMDKQAFLKVNEAVKKAGREPFVNARNCAAGSLRQKDPRITASRGLKFFAHSHGRLEGAASYPKGHWEFLEACRRWGLPVSGEEKRCRTLKDIIDYHRRFKDRLPELPYDADGIVVKVDSHEEQMRLGWTSRSPRWAVAFKYPARQARTKVRDVAFFVSRTGTITPVAELEPVFCAGVTISSATLHNFEEVKRLDIRVGDEVVIERAGEVIPKVVRVEPKSRTGKERTVHVPKSCPVCGGAVVREEGFVAYACANPSCPAQIKGGLLHFASRGGLDIQGLGDVVVEQVVDKGYVRDFADLFRLKKDQLLSLELFADKRAQNLLDQIEEAKSRPLSRLLYALGIRHVGERTARDLAGHFGALEAVAQASSEELEAVSEIGPVVAGALAQFFRQRQVKDLMAKLKEAGVNFKEPKRLTTAELPLAGKNFVFTGELSIARSEAEAKVRQMGGEASSSVSKKTSYVVAGASPGSKLDKAKKLGVPVLDEEAFLRLLKG